MMKVLYVRVPAELHDYVNELAREGGLPVSKVVEAILRRAFEAGMSVSARAD